MKDQESFKPYIPAEKITAEMTATSVIMGIILSVVFGAANAYLGLRVGMTVSASIPAAVISMGVIRVLLKKNSILESNMVQTIGSAGESLAAGAIFTMPALFLWAKEGLCDKPSILEITLIALCGGILGVLFMVPLRNALIVKEHATLLYPEGTACADVLLAGEEGGANASTVFSGMGLAAIFKFIVDGLKMIPADIAVAFSSFKGALGMEVYPALLGVGYIVGPKTASYMFTGSLVGWMVIIPLICLFGANISLYPAAAGTTIADLYAAGGADAIWSNYVKYIGAGAIATGGIISLIKSLPLIASTFRDAMKSMKGGSASGTSRTEKDLPMPFILGGILLIILIIWLASGHPRQPAGCSADRHLRLLLLHRLCTYGRHDRQFQQPGLRHDHCHPADRYHDPEGHRQRWHRGHDRLHGHRLCHLHLRCHCCGYLSGPEDRLPAGCDPGQAADR